MVLVINKKDSTNYNKIVSKMGEGSSSKKSVFK